MRGFCLSRIIKMGISETYSNSKKELPDVFIYDAIEIKLKNQIYHIWNDFFDQKVFDNYEEKAKEEIFKQLCKTEGKKKLYHDIYGYRNDYEKQVEKYFEEISDVEKILDVIQITFYYVELVEKLVLNNNPYTSINYSAKEAIEDLNYRFKENGVGYEYSNGKIIRIDNKLLHQETIKFTLLLLTEKKYKNANDEFIKAHEHFKHRRNQECLNECLKSFESTMKIICDENKWLYNQNDTAKPLINILITNNFYQAIMKVQ